VHKKHSHSHHNYPDHPHFNKRKTAYIISASAIGLVFLVSIIALLGGKFTPRAAETVGKTTLPAGQFGFNTVYGAYINIYSNILQFDLAPLPSGYVQLQGIKQSNTTPSSIIGTVTVATSSGQKLLANPVSWTGGSFVNDTQLKSEFSNSQFSDAVDTVPLGTNLRVIVKPKNYLAVESSTTNIDAPLSFPSARAGDLTNDNKIDEVDFSKWTRYFGKNTDDSNREYDFNRDGKIDEVDFSMAFTVNFGKSGVN
jgi:hypothetical protein